MQGCIEAQSWAWACPWAFEFFSKFKHRHAHKHELQISVLFFFSDYRCELSLIWALSTFYNSASVASCRCSIASSELLNHECSMCSEKYFQMIGFCKYCVLKNLTWPEHRISRNAYFREKRVKITFFCPFFHRNQAQNCTCWMAWPVRDFLEKLHLTVNWGNEGAVTMIMPPH